MKVITSGGKFTIGQYSIYTGYVIQFQSGISTIYRSFLDLFEGNQFMTVYNEVMDLDTEYKLPEGKQLYKLSPDEPITIRFEHVNFKYPSGNKLVFKDLNITINPGDHIALVGQNGAGKTTLIKLLLRFYDPGEGHIYLNDHDLKEVDLTSWYQHIGVLFQSYNRYPLSFDENISIGRVENPNKPLVLRAAKLAGISKLRDSLSEKGQTILHPAFTNGQELSVGQWQKVAIARAFYRDASILILDEPTSAVDAKAESEIFDKIHSIQKLKTTLIVSHRFSTVRQADHIYVLKNGQIIEDGSHTQLMKINGLYKQMFEKQAAGYR